MSAPTPTPPTPPYDPVIFVGEEEGQPLIVQLDRSFGRNYADPARPHAILIEFRLARVDGHGLPPQDDWPQLADLESALVRALATDDDDWRYVVRLYGVGLARFGFYAQRPAGTDRRVKLALASLPDLPSPARIRIQPDPTWSAYAQFFPADPATEGLPPSFRDDTPYDAPLSRSARTTPEDQPYRADDNQLHPAD